MDCTFHCVALVTWVSSEGLPPGGLCLKWASGDSKYKIADILADGQNNTLYIFMLVQKCTKYKVKLFAFIVVLMI